MQSLALLGILIQYFWMTPNLEEGDWKSGFQRLKLDRKGYIIMIKLTSSQANIKCKIIYSVKKKQTHGHPFRNNGLGSSRAKKGSGLQWICENVAK